MVPLSSTQALAAIKEALTCAFFDAGSFFHGVSAELALKVVLPELGKPDVSSVVLQGPADEVAVKA